MLAFFYAVLASLTLTNSIYCQYYFVDKKSAPAFIHCNLPNDASNPCCDLWYHLKRLLPFVVYSATFFGTWYVLIGRRCFFLVDDFQDVPWIHKIFIGNIFLDKNPIVYFRWSLCSEFTWARHHVCTQMHAPNVWEQSQTGLDTII